MSEHANYLTPKSQKMFFAVLNCQGSIRSIPLSGHYGLDIYTLTAKPNCIEHHFFLRFL